MAENDAFSMWAFISVLSIRLSFSLST